MILEITTFTNDWSFIIAFPVTEMTDESKMGEKMFEITHRIDEEILRERNNQSGIVTWQGNTVLA